MSDIIYQAFAGGMNVLNTQLTAAFAPDDIRCFLLKRGEHSGELVSVAEVENGFFSEWDSYREQTQFSFATTDADFADDFAQATHIGYGVPDDDSDIEVFEISDDLRDKITPSGTSPFWKAYGTRTATERYAIAPPDINYLTVGGNYLTIGGNRLAL